jgi:hypothetical protein
VLLSKTPFTALASRISCCVSAPATTRPAAAAPALPSSRLLLILLSSSPSEGSEPLVASTSSRRPSEPSRAATLPRNSAFSRSSASSLRASPSREVVPFSVASMPLTLFLYALWWGEAPCNAPLGIRSEGYGSRLARGDTYAGWYFSGSERRRSVHMRTPRTPVGGLRFLGPCRHVPRTTRTPTTSCAGDVAGACAVAVPGISARRG